MGEEKQAERKPLKVIEVDLDLDDEEEQPVTRTATAEAVGATVQEEKNENMQTPIRVTQTPAKETHGEVETGRPMETEKGAERRYPSQERKLPAEWFGANMASDAQRGPTGPTMEAKIGLEKGPDVNCVGVVTPTRERQPSKHGTSRTEKVWVTPRAKERADNRKG
jgi:hypothetical protein